MWAINALMPMHRDDYGYALIYGTRDRLASWHDVFKSLYIHYFEHGGRMVAYFVLDSFLFIGKQWFNPFNSLCFVSLIILIHWHAMQKITWRFNPYILLYITMFLWLGLPHFAEVNVWMSGAVGYLLTSVVILTFLLPYHFALLKKPIIKDGIISIVGMFLCGIAAGWSIENTAAATTFGVILLTFYAYKRMLLEKWMFSGVCGSIIGLSLLVAAPGNFVRFVDKKTPVIYHFTNLIATAGEVSLYILPIILFFILAKRVILVAHSAKIGLPLPSLPAETRLNASPIIIISLISVMLFSYLNSNFFSKFLCDLLYNNVAIPLGVGSPRLQIQLANTMSGIEEMAIYLLTVIQIFRYAFAKSGLHKKNLEPVLKSVKLHRLAPDYPILYSVAVWLLLALLTHCAMVAAPSFPARASYGSVVFFIIATISLFNIPAVHHFFLDTASHKKYLTFCFSAIMIPMVAATLYYQNIILKEDTARMNEVARLSAQGVKQIAVDPISTKIRVLRHIYVVDVNNGVTRGHICDYYRLDDIKLK